MAIVALIPARGGSKGIPGKNLAKIGGDTLLARAAWKFIKSYLRPPSCSDWSHSMSFSLPTCWNTLPIPVVFFSWLIALSFQADGWLPRFQTSRIGLCDWIYFAVDLSTNRLASATRLTFAGLPQTPSDRCSKRTACG